MYLIKSAMIFAAGLGTRMSHLTNDIPKPLICVNGRPMIDIILDRLVEFGVEKVVINCHYLAQKLIHHLSKRTDITIVFSYEENLLETGGGLVNALPILGPSNPMLTVNSDTIWKSNELLEKLEYTWEISNNLTMVFYSCHQMALPMGGQFNLTSKGDVYRTKTGEGDVIFAGIQLINPEILEPHFSKDKFSLNDVFVKAENENKQLINTKGFEYKGKLFHVGTEQELQYANDHFV